MRKITQIKNKNAIMVTYTYLNFLADGEHGVTESVQLRLVLTLRGLHLKKV